MMKRFCWGLLIIFIFAPGVIAAPSHLILNQQNDRSVVRLERDTVAVIELEANPSTGYIWEANIPTNSPVQIMGRQFVSSKPGMIGSSGVEKVYVAGMDQGQAPVTFRWKRASSSEKALKKLTFTFESEGRLQESFEMPESETSELEGGVQGQESVADSRSNSDTPSIGCELTG